MTSNALRLPALWCSLLAVLPALLLTEVRAADIGGWTTHRDRIKQAQAAPSCPQVVARATAEGSAQSAFEAGLCYLHADPADVVAAKAWLTRAASQNHLHAHRMLKSVQRIDTLAHPTSPHCHDLGEGRMLCHGGASPLDPSRRSGED